MNDQDLEACLRDAKAVGDMPNAAIVRHPMRKPPPFSRTRVTPAAPHALPVELLALVYFNPAP